MAKYYGGCDAGSTYTKCVILDETGKIAANITKRSRINPVLSAKDSLDEAVALVDGLNSADELDYLIGTGYGRNKVPFADENISEISCHAMGVHVAAPDVKAIVTYVLWGVTYTMMDIPYWSMIPAFTEGGKERENMSTMARSCAGVGSALVTIITMQCVYMLGKGNEYAGFKWFALIISILFFAAILITCFNIREKSTVDVETVSVKQMFKALFQNDQAVTVVITIVLINTSVYITSNLVIYFFKYDFGGADWYNGYTLFNTFGGAIQILSMMVLFPLLRKFLNTIKIFYVSFVMAIAGYIVLFILIFTSMSSVFILFIPAFFIFAANGMLLVLTTIFLANTVDYGEFKNKRRDESVIFSMQTFVVKLASGIAALVVSICLSVCRLSSNTDVVTDAVAGGSVVGLRMTMTVIPVIGLLIAVFYFHRKYILTEQKMEEISERIKESH